MSRVLLAADLHLGGTVAAPLPGLAQPAGRARRQALERLVRLAEEQEAAAILFAGDIFEQPNPPLADLLAWQEALGRLSAGSRQVLVAPGNHDPHIGRSIWQSWQPPAGVQVFGPEPRGVALPELGLWVAGAGHASAHEERNLARLLPPPPEGLTGLALLHADIRSASGAEQHQAYAPARLADLTATPYAGWCLGHIHKPQELSTRPMVVYAGCLQGGHFKDSGPRGCWLLEVEPQAISARFIALAPLCFLDWRWDDLGDIADPSHLAARLRQQLASEDLPAESLVCLRLALEGPSPLWRQLSGNQAADLAAELAQRLGLAGLLLDASGLIPPQDPAALASEPHLLGRLLARMAQMRSDPAALEGLQKELAGHMHPLAAQLSPEQARDRLAELLDLAQARALRDLWQGEGDEA